MASKNKPSIQNIPAHQLIIDHKVQRDPPTATRISQLMEKFDLDRMGIITVSKRKGGDKVVLDGQTRLAVLDRLDLLDWEATCNVYTGLTEAEEAHLFRILNNTRKPTPYDDFKVAMTEGDPESLAILAIIHRHGLKLSPTSTDGGIACVSALRDCYRVGIESLDRALGTAIGAWGMRADAMSASIVRGLSIVHDTYGDEIDRTALIKKLSKCQGGAAGVLGQARMSRYIRSAPVARLCAATIVSLYNRGRRNGALADL